MGATLLGFRNTKLAPFFNPTGMLWLARIRNPFSKELMRYGVCRTGCQ
jgi:hypothetical protein